MSLISIARSTGYQTSAHAYEDVVEVASGERNFICAATARTIASWWQSPGRIGHVLASLASGAIVHLDQLLDDIDATRREASEHGYENEHDEEALAQLREWAIDQGYEEVDA